LTHIYELVADQMLVGECKDVMTRYLACMKKVKGVNDPQCRYLAKEYLACRMDRNLMARDEFKNLGFKDDTAQPSTDSKPSDEGAKGELRW
jgi:cytochrome c oxidase assembly protein subunit 19